jgi:uncharacterized membrane protein YphA (DoxX/SURF4 family)
MALFKKNACVRNHSSASLRSSSGNLIIIGLWTPVAGSLIAVAEVWTALADPGNPGTAILLATLGVTLAMIGPGAFSIDARLFGRKHFGS